MKRHVQPWLANPWQESIFIMAPSFAPVLIVFIFNDYFTTQEVNPFWWIALVLCIDVTHVYSTLFRLYWDKETFAKYRQTLVLIPLVSFAFGLALHLYDDMLFWRVLAYVAVYHFIRQQYGFMRLYSRKDVFSNWSRKVDAIAIYNATLYPLLYWHINSTDKLAWFVKGDFINLELADYNSAIAALYFGILLLYLAKEFGSAFQNRMINVPKNLIVIGTYASWYVGIVAFQADLIFTFLNIVAHGIPYMALVWLHGQKRATSDFKFNAKGVIIFLCTLILFAYVEEALWDKTVWHDHSQVFPLMPDFSIQQSWLISVIVAFLVLPQMTHYVLDGFIWRFSKDRQARIE